MQTMQPDSRKTTKLKFTGLKFNETKSTPKPKMYTLEMNFIIVMCNIRVVVRLYKFKRKLKFTIINMETIRHFVISIDVKS